MVAHLTFEELLEFNSLNYSEAREGALATRVTSHVRTCLDCRRALTAIQSTEDTVAEYYKRRAAGARRTETNTEGNREKLF